MLSLKLSTIVLEIPNKAWYTALSWNLIGCSTLSQEYCKLIGWYWKIMRRQFWTLKCPIIHTACISELSVSTVAHSAKSVLLSLHWSSPTTAAAIPPRGTTLGGLLCELSACGPAACIKQQEKLVINKLNDIKMKSGMLTTIPQCNFFAWFSRHTQSKSYTLSLTKCVWEFRHNALWDTY